MNEIGPIIEHTYKILNEGPFSIQFFQLVIEWPHETRLNNLNELKQGNHLIYLIEKPTVNFYFYHYYLFDINLWNFKENTE